MTDLDQVVHRLAGAAMLPVRRVGGMVTKLTVLAAIVAVSSLLLGVRALDGTAQTVWVVLSIVFGWIAISRGVRLRWNIARLLNNQRALEDEIRMVIQSRPPDDPLLIELSFPDPAAQAGEDIDMKATEVWNTQFLAGSMFPGSPLRNFRWISLAVRSAKQLGLTVAMSGCITVVFAGVGLVFLIALALS